MNTQSRRFKYTDYLGSEQQTNESGNISKTTVNNTGKESGRKPMAGEALIKPFILL